MDCHPVERCFHVFALGCVDPCVLVRLSEAAFGGLIKLTCWQMFVFHRLSHWRSVIYGSHLQGEENQDKYL